MANQAVALQARAPQTNFMGQAIQQNAQMMNMMSQQRAAERQAAQAAQAMEIARAKEGREATAAEIDNAGKLIDLYTKRAGQTMTPEGYSLLLKDLDRDAPEIAAAFRANLPEANFDRNTLLRMVGSISDNFKATYGPLETEVVQALDGTFSIARTGGFGKPGVFELEQYELAPQGAGAPSTTPTPTAPPTALPTGGVNARATRGTATAPADLRAQGVDPRSIPSGNPLRPISMTEGAPAMGGAQPDLTAVVQDMMQSGKISQANLQLMRDAAGPDKDAQLAQILKANNIQIVPDEQPSPRSAVFRPSEDAAPQMQQVQDMGDYRPTGRAARGKPPTVSPSQVPSSAGDVTRATTAASEGVRVQTQPTIVAGEERMRRVEKLRGELPRARADAQALIADLDERIKAIDVFLRSPYRNSIIGAIEGRIPRMLQTPARADAQALYDSIKDNTTLTRLLSDRSQTETGASPLGVVSDRDVDMVARAATRLTQTGTERQQELEMQRLRDLMYQTRQQAIETYNTTYREVLPETPALKLRVPSIAPKYRAKPEARTPTRRGAPESGWGKAEVVDD